MFRFWNLFCFTSPLHGFSFNSSSSRNLVASSIKQGFYPAACFRGSVTLSGEGGVEWPKATSRCAKRRAGEGSGNGMSPPQGWGSGLSLPGKILKFKTHFGAIWCSVRNREVLLGGSLFSCTAAPMQEGPGVRILNPLLTPLASAMTTLTSL